jgi:hypothetical protein
MVNLFLLLVDRDGKAGRKHQLAALEKRAETVLGKVPFIGEAAWQEVEVWLLAGHQLPDDWSWAEIRTHLDPKETYFLPFARGRGLLDEPGEGRKTLGLEAARNYGRLRALCPELKDLETRVRPYL